MTAARTDHEYPLKAARRGAGRVRVWATVSRVSGRKDTGASILVVEDDEQIAELMRDFLEAEGFRVRVAGTGHETSEQLARGSPDLVLLDVMLPDESGFEICRRTRNRSAQAPRARLATHRHSRQLPHLNRASPFARNTTPTPSQSGVLRV